MIIMKNALRNITRAKGRNFLLGCIAFVIGLSACLALSIKEAAKTQKAEGLASLHISASIQMDREAMMEGLPQPGQEDSSSEDVKSNFKEKMANMQELSLEELQTYAKAASVKDFYYTMNTSVDGKDIEAVSTSQSDKDSSQPEGMPQGKGGDWMNQGDFTLEGYSSYDAMSGFVNGNNSLQEGAMFEEGSDAFTCIINKELATLNSIQVGDTITLANPSNSKQTWKLKVVGLYTSTDSQETQMGRTMSDPANQIYLSYEALNTIVKASETKEDTALRAQTNGTYTFANLADYEAFEDEAKALGLSDDYTVTSQDVNAYEQSLLPLENLSTYATYFLIVMLGIGGVILVILNIYHIKSRKYEIGVLAAIGMRKRKIALQFLCEIFLVTLLGIVLGSGIGAVSSVPLTNALLETQTAQSETTESPFAKEPGMMKERAMAKQSYIEEISSATDGKVVVELGGLALILTMLSGGIAVLSILRYEPLKILANRE